MVQPQSKLYSLRHALIVTALATIALPACKKEGEIPSSPAARVVDLAEHLPATTEGAVFVGDLKAMRETLTTIKAEIGPLVPQLEGYQKEISNELGLDVLDAATYAQAGIADAGTGVAYINGQVALFVYVQDPVKFDTFFAERAKKVTGATAEPKTETVNELQVKVVGELPKQVAWVHAGKLVIIGSKTANAAADGPGVAQLVAGLAKTDKTQSLATTAAFKDFNKALPGDKYAMTVMGNPKALAETKEFKELEAETSKDASAQESLSWYKKNTASIGAGLAKENRELKLSLFYGASDELKGKLKELTGDVPKSPWSNFATKQTVLGLRTAFNFAKAYSLIKETMPEKDRTEFQQEMAKGGEKFGVNLEQDILNNLTGNFGVFFYGLNMGKAMTAGQNPDAMMSAVNLVAGAQFKDKAKLTSTFDKVVAAINAPGEDGAPSANLAVADFEGGKSLALPQDSGTIYLKDDMLFFAAAESNADQIKATLAGKGDKLTDDLGIRFSADAPYNGIYLNTPALMSTLGPLAAMSPWVASLDKLEAASLTADTHDQGMTTTLRLRLKPAQGGAAQ